MTTRIAKNRKNPAKRQCQWLCIAALLFALVYPTGASAQRVWRMLVNADTYAIAINPKNERTLYAGGSARRLYRSYDAGRTWDTLAVEFVTGSGWLSNVFIHPIDTNVIIVGGSQLGTVQRSTDNGATWTRVIDPSPYPITLNGEVITAHPDSSDVVYLGGLNPATIYRSNDRGQTWDSISTIEDVPFLCTLAMRTDSTNVILAGCADGIIHKSVDGGRTWYKTTMVKNVEDPFESIEIPKIVMSKTNPMVGYATATCFAPNSLPNGGVYRTTNGGETWRHFAFADTSMWSLALGGEDYTRIFTGGFSAHELIRGAGFVREINDAGLSGGSPLWLDIGLTVPWQPGNHDNIKNMWMMKVGGPAVSPILYMATEAGLFVYDDYAVSVSEKLSPYEVDIALSSDGIIRMVVPDGLAGPVVVRCFDILGNSMGELRAEGAGTHSLSPGRMAAGSYYIQALHRGRIVGAAFGACNP